MSDYKFKNIIIKKNGLIIGIKNKSTWLTISTKKLFYLSWPDGRIYFFLDKLSSDSNVKNIQNDSISKTVKFTYDGDWELDNPFRIVQVNDTYEIEFKESKDWKKIEKTLGVQL